MRLLFLLSSLIALGQCAHVNGSNWDPPGWQLLFSCNASMTWFIDMGATSGDSSRVILPISGGQFQGPKLEGKVLAVGADWLVTDQFNATDAMVMSDARFNLRTNDGADIYVQMKGKGRLAIGYLVHVRAEFETSNKNYTWLNDVIALGMLEITRFGYIMDMWQVISPPG